MQTVILKTGSFGETELTTQLLIKTVLDSPPQGGFLYRDFKERARVENAMDNIKPADETNSYPYFELEDRDFDNLAKWSREQKWAIRSPFISDYIDGFDKKVN